MSLPGVSTLIKDRFFPLSRTDIPTGPRVLILGRRNNDDGSNGVSDLDPFNVSGEETVIASFGAESDLHRGYLEAIAGGAQRVVCVGLPSDTVFDHDNGVISSAAFDESVANTSTNTPNDLFDAAFAAVESAQADVVVPWGRGSGPTEFQNPATPGDDAEIGFHADNATDDNSWAVKVANKIALITNESNPCFAVLGVAPFAGNSSSTGGMTPAQVQTHLQLTDLVDKDDTSVWEIDEDGKPITNGPYLSVIVGELEPLGYNKNYDFGFSNGAAMYAGYVAQLDSWSAPTGKVIFNVKGVRYNPTRSQQNTLVDKGVVPVSLNFTKTPVWVDAQTFASTGSDYGRLTTLRIVFDAVQVVRQVSTKFIGEATSTEMRNALETAITSGLRGMQQLGALLSSDFTVTYVPLENLAIVELVLNPAFELRNILVKVSVQL